MNALMVPLNDEEMSRLRESARKAQLSLEEVARQGINAYLEREAEFERIKTYLLHKNAELYRRLAQ
jgi:predicted transcriptional regulator